MAIFHLSAKSISRSAGRSATAAAAYRSGSLIVDERTGEIHDYRKKGGVESADLLLPQGGTADRSEFWNSVEKHHKRGDAVVSREVEVALPAELPPAERRRLALDFAQQLADRYGVAADVAIHQPGKEGDDRNHHAHIMLSACYCSHEGQLGKKAVELDPIHCQRAKIPNLADAQREIWASMTNERLREFQIETSVDHRSLKDQKIDREPTSHLGPSVTDMKRSKKQSEVLARIEAEVLIEKMRKNSTAADEYLLQKTAQEIQAAQTELKALTKKMREEKAHADIAISQYQTQADLHTNLHADLHTLPDIVISPSTETAEQYTARKSQQYDRRFTIAKIGQRVAGTLQKIKELAGHIYGVIDVGLGDRLLVKHDFHPSNINKKIKGYQRQNGFESDLDRAPKDKDRSSRN